MDIYKESRRAWITGVNTDEELTTALILAESLRKSLTTKRIVVLISEKVTRETTLLLRRSFDDVFLLDKNLVSTEIHDKLRGKIFAFSLNQFEQCIYLTPDMIVLENIDKLFDKSKICEGFSPNWDMFLFTPNLELCQFLATEFHLGSTKHTHFWNQHNTFVDNVKIWLKNNSALKTLTTEMNNGNIMVTEFSANTGTLDLKGSDYPFVLRITDTFENKNGLLAAMKSLNRPHSTLGYIEKQVLQEWLLIHTKVQESLLNSSMGLNTIRSYKCYENEPIAIIGMSCRFPGANNLEEFWNLLYTGSEGIRKPPPFRWTKQHSIFNGAGKQRDTNAGFLSVPIDEFDAKFFGINQKDAVFLDPQAKLLHEVLWESLENGGVDPLSLRGTQTGIFAGSWMNDYKDIVQASTERDFFRTYMGNSIGTTAARLSLLLGLTGPNIATESGCSSAIVAVDMAVKSLRSGESSLALAAGVNLLLHPFQGDIIEYVIAPDGRCKTFDEKADGFGRAEGCGVLVLKRLRDALRDKDHIWAMIRGSAITQEGVSRSFGTPTVHSEALAMKLALKDAGVQAEHVSFVETHGTGTSVGDPMEVAAIASAYHTENRKEPLVIGSVKTNVGHTESCSGITGIIKTVLALQHELIPKHLNLNTLNPEVKLDAIPACVPLEALEWPKVKGCPRLAGVSSFGITGTDGHVILEEAPDNTLPSLKFEVERPLHLIKFSAKSNTALNELMKRYENLFQAPDFPGSFPDLAYTANVGRAAFNHRCFLVASNLEQASSIIQTNKMLRSDITGKEPGKICFLFTGQGCQYSGMAMTLYKSSPIFRLHFDRCETILRERYKISISDVLWDSKAESNRLSQTIYSQTSIFCAEYCLLKLWESWGIKPDYVLGHSLGEFCAAVAARILTFEDALTLVAERSRLIDTLPRGGMLVIKSNVQEVENLMMEHNIDLDVAAVNSIEQTVVAGNSEKILQLFEICKEKSMKSIKLDATHAFHSSHMDPILEAYRSIATNVKAKSGTCQFISGVTGLLVESPEMKINAEYWVRHTRERVSFLAACKTVKNLECHTFLEIGPQPILSSFIMQNIECAPVSCHPSLRRNFDEWETILRSLGKLYLEGFKIDWESFDRPFSRKKIPTVLPIHPFERKSYWVDCSSINLAPIHPLIGSSINNASNLGIFQNTISMKSAYWIQDHCIGKRVVMAGAAIAEMCMSAGFSIANSWTDFLEKPTRPMGIVDFKINSPLQVLADKQSRLQVIVDTGSSTLSSNSDEQLLGFGIKVYSHNDQNSESAGKWIHHASSKFLPVVNTKEILAELKQDHVKSILKSTDRISTSAFYKRAEGIGLRFGESFKSIQCYTGKLNENKHDEIIAEVKIPKDHNNFVLHPIITDAMLQSIILSMWKTQKEVFKMPVSIGKFIWLNNIAKNSTIVYLHTWWENENCKIFALNEDLSPIAFISDVNFVEMTVKMIDSVLDQQFRAIPDCWEEVWKPIRGPHDGRVVLPPLQQTLSDKSFLKQIKEETEDIFKDREHFHATNRLIYLYTLRSVLQLGWSPRIGELVHVDEFCDKYKILSIYHRLMMFNLSMFESENGLLEKLPASECAWKVICLPPSLNELDVEINQLIKLLMSEKKVEASTRIHQYIGNHLHSILSGREQALQILFPPDPSKKHLSAETYYFEYPGKANTLRNNEILSRTILSKIKETVRHDNNVLYRVLEVGAGTGQVSEHALRELNKTWGNRFEFFFTDISPVFFSKAAKRLEKFKENLRFGVFNIEERALDQGIPLNYFDMVLANNVFHATKNLGASIKIVRETMTPNGTLLINETLSQDRGLTFVFGLLEGYWRYEDVHVRPDHPCVSPSVWNDLLLKSGFHYTYYVDGYVNTMGTIAAEASSQWAFDTLQEPNNNKRWVIFADTGNSMHMHLIKKLAVLGISNITVVSLNSKHGCYLPNTVTLVQSDCKCVPKLLEILEGENLNTILYLLSTTSDEQSQSNISLPLINILKHVTCLKKPPNIFVVTKGGHRVVESFCVTNPSSATLFGILKTIKNECSDVFLRYVDIEEDNTPDLETVTNQILFELAMTKESEKDRVQVAYRGNMRYEPKFTSSHILRINESLKLPPCTKRYKLLLPENRMINDLSFDILEEESVADNQIQVETKAYSLNFRDVFSILKPSKEFESLNAIGLDFSGVVTKVGEKVNPEKIKVGDRVCGVVTKESQLASHIVLDTDVCVLKIPSKWSFAEAATLPAVFTTSIYCLVDTAELNASDTVLIHTGSGGVGLSAIQVAKHLGANVITTAGTPRKRAYLRSLGIQHVFHSRDTSYQQEIMRVTNGVGVNVVLNSITGAGFKEATLAVCAPNARFVEMSKLNVWTEKEVEERRPDVKYTIVDLTVLDRSWLNAVVEKVDKFTESDKILPIPHTSFDALRIRQALQYLQKAKHIGKIIVHMPEICISNGQFNISVPVFNSESTYLITGGLGGIGFEVCKWMLNKGASNIVLIGRNPPNKEIDTEIQKLNEDPQQNVSVELGDVGDYEQMKLIIDRVSQTYSDKPIRGIQHCAGVLRDNMFIDQTWESFEAAFTPKVKGTWNLHNLTLSMRLEHFVLYSSITALAGTICQANHAAANGFEDAFAHFRHSMGLPATSINWGQWSQVGCAKEMNLPGILPVTVVGMLNGLEEVLRNPTVQISLANFESLHLWSMNGPMLKHYIDEKLFRHLNLDQNEHFSMKSDEFWKEIDEAADNSERMEVVIAYIKHVLRNALRLDSNEPINEEASMQELGIDSLMLLEMKNSIQGFLGSRVTVTISMLKDCETIRDLATVIVNKISDSETDAAITSPLSPEEFRCLLESDCRLVEEIKQASQPPESLETIKSVLLTGATGQLGPYVLSGLSQKLYHQPLEKIICLIRCRKGQNPCEKLETILQNKNLLDKVDMDMVECVRGDVGLPNFGLPEKEYASLCQSIDCVFHLAAKSNHLEHYRKCEKATKDIRSINVEGTMSILRFASTGKTKHIFYSSGLIGILGANDEGTLCDDWPEENQISIIADHGILGYPTSKYVSEMLLKQANERGIPCKIFRFPWIMGESMTGQINYSKNHYILRFLSYLKIKSMPITPMPALVLPVDTCADMALQIFWNIEARNEIYNITPPDPQLETEFVKAAKDAFGIEIKLVEWRSKEFIEDLYASDMPLESLKEIYEDVDRGITLATSEAFKAIQGYLKAPQTFFRNRKVEKYLSSSYKTNIDSSMEIIIRDLNYVKSEGIFKKFKIE